MPPSSAPADSKPRCTNCLLPAGLRLLHDFFPVGPEFQATGNISVVELDAAGLCPYCRLFQQNYDRHWLEQELLSWLDSLQHSGQPALLALSGGKDSLCALFLLAKVLKRPVRAFTLDNGYLPTVVLEQTERICREWNVPWEVVSDPLQREFSNEYQRDAQGRLQARTGLDFCQLCSGRIRKALLQICRQQGHSHVVFGNKTYTQLTPRVSCLKTLPLAAGGSLQVINLLFALRTNTTQMQNMLQDMNWQDPQLKGYTSNCLIPGLVAAARQRTLGYPADAGYIEMELRSGAWTRAEAEALLREQALSTEAET